MNSDDDDAMQWEAASASSSELSEAEESVKEAVEVACDGDDAKQGKKRKRKRTLQEAQVLASLRRWRQEHVAVHQAQLVTACCRLRLASEWCESEMVSEACRAATSEHTIERLHAACTGKTVMRGAVEAILQPLRRALKDYGTEELGSEPRVLAERCISGNLRSSDAVQLVVSLCRSFSFADAVLVAAMDPLPCRRSQRQRRRPRKAELWGRVGDVLIIDARPTRTPLRKVPYIVEYTAEGQLMDVTGRYYEPPERLPKALLKEWWPNVLAALSSSKSSRPAPQTASLPTRRAAFRDHAIYALRSTLSKRQRLSETARKVGLFKGEDVYLRCDVAELKTAREWLRSLRQVKDDAENGPFFSFDQTEPWQPQAVAPDDSLPLNQYGDISIIDGDPNLVPAGGVWFRGNDARTVAKACDIPHAPVMIGWDRPTDRLFSAGSAKPRPKRDGVLVAESQAAALRSALFDHTRARRRAQRRAHARARIARWSRVVQKLLSRQRLRAEYLPSE